MKKLTVNEVSKLTGVSIRTLQYYDKIGLLKPTEYTKAGYKKYDRTSKSKDVLIEAKNRRIAKLEEENLQLRRELDNLRRLLYEQK